MLFRSPRPGRSGGRPPGTAEHDPHSSLSPEGAMRRICLLSIAALLLFASGTARAQLPTASAYAVCSADSFYVIWTTYDPDPYGYPDWMGFDIKRRAVPGCGEYEILNADIIPRALVTTTQYF